MRYNYINILHLTHARIINNKLLNQLKKTNILIMPPKRTKTTQSTLDSFVATPTPSKQSKLEGNLIETIRQDRINCGPSVEEFNFNKKRVRILTKETRVSDDAKGILYWMSRDQRVQDNWALLYAQRLAIKTRCPLHVCFCLVPSFLDATIRHYMFMIKGLKEVEIECRSLDIQFHLLLGQAVSVLPQFIKSHGISGIVTDFSPLRVPREWITTLVAKLPQGVPLCQVDAHNIVPCWIASDKLEYAARTIRKKITDKLPEYLTHFPPVVNHPFPSGTKCETVDWISAEESLRVNMEVKEVDWANPGTKAGLLMLESFVKDRLKNFNELRNNPNKNALSNLSPWFHFGQISVQRAILVVNEYKSKYKASVEAFVEESVVRRELADNFCYYNPKYDSIDGGNDWAKKTLQDHVKDKREYLYSLEQFEKGLTHDDLWNGAQLQMVRQGKMHGFLRMYWAKKILEWTKTPEEALKVAIYLNDKYELDGRDPNGYVGCMWSIVGIHDQGWGERSIFGKIRFMNYQGCKRKFDVKEFESRFR